MEAPELSRVSVVSFGKTSTVTAEGSQVNARISEARRNEEGVYSTRSGKTSSDYDGTLCILAQSWISLLRAHPQVSQSCQLSWSKMDIAKMSFKPP